MAHDEHPKPGPVAEQPPGARRPQVALGTPVVATDCPSDPGEILHGGRYGEPVPVGDSSAVAAAIRRVLEWRTAAGPADEAWLDQIREETATGRYLELIGDAAGPT